MDNKELDDELLRQGREIQKKREMKRKRRQRQQLIKAACCVGALALIVILTTVLTNSLGLKDGSSRKKKQTETASEAVKQTETEDKRALLMEEAELLAAGYDYDGAIAKLQSFSGYENDAELLAAVSKYTASKEGCVAVDVEKVPHIFFQSLVNDPAVSFSGAAVGEETAADANSQSVTAAEFDQIIQQMYDNGYVLVRMRDLAVETKDAQGNVTFTRNENLMLPAGKKAVVLSVDDLSYYHEYEKAGYPTKLVLDGDGKVKCSYTKADGTTVTGDYDVVPRLNTFLEEHPDASYHGARGMIALTGYEGVFGYRTDPSYKTRENLSAEQNAWLAANTGFNWDSEVSAAKKIAAALKEEGWEFASHTWGHLNVTNESLDSLKADNEKWVESVQSIVGETDTIMFTGGGDIGDWQDYSANNPKYQYFKEQGYHYFCNVDSSTPYWVQLRSDYLRQGRVAVAGYTLYRATQGQTQVFDGLFNIQDVFDTTRAVPITLR